ncbi:Transposase, IS605 family [Desulfonema limicola]|uniref:Transposase, IS605 family n=1 Tax=Desulfonema limicola TaxID=45656 RepID=A0A975BDA1_9BACT|nr:zinc ribbon domain-containing protein [Desulfonema limicola]QTA83237.1 Transposase, IS605 family [Desulfonema limicola]
MKIKRSSKVTIKLAAGKKREILDGIHDEYARTANFFIDYFWDHPEIRSANQITSEIYSLPETWLTARMRQCAAREALSMVLGARNIENRRKSSIELEAEELLGEEIFTEPVKPVHNGKKMTLSSQVVRIEKGRNSFDLWMVVHSVGNGIKLYIPLKKHRQFNKWAEIGKMGSSVVINRQHVQISFEIETGEKKQEGKLVGIDAGINHLMTTSKREFLGNEVSPLISKIKRKHQGSKAYKRAKKELSYYIHKTVKDYFADNNLQLVVTEKLKNLKHNTRQKNRTKELRKTLSNWNYRELLNIIQMRCEENRVSFRSVSPFKTSQKCPNPDCAHTQRENRNNEEFKCLKCGYSEQADYVGSLNILYRFLTGPYGAGFKT